MTPKCLSAYILILFLFSCTPDDSAKFNCPLAHPEIFKEINLEADYGLASLTILVFAEELQHLDKEDFNLKPTTFYSQQDSIHEQKGNSGISSGERKVRCPSILIKDIYLDPPYNALNLSFSPSIHNERFVIDIDGTCKVADQDLWGRAVGFKGRPIDCHYTNWIWSYKDGCKYASLYKKTSSNTYDNISYKDEGLHHDTYQLIIEPKSNCIYQPSLASFSILYAFSKNRECL